MRTQILMVSLSFACFLAMAHPAVAGRIDVVNENKKSLTVKIKAEGDNINENLATYIKEIPTEYYFTFMVESSDLKGKSHYSIKGDTNAFTPGGKCDHLSVDKNYKVTFLNDVAGTTCVAEEIK
ncbi:MAG: hypothetical protein JNK42_00485 [Caedimonas sp.]|nr:hypothetical protein [Caedimonas sp.]